MAVDRFGGGKPPVFRPDSTDGEDKKRSPIGVPDDYTTLTSRSWTPSPGRSGRVDTAALRYMAEQKPRYMEGDEWKPANNSPAGIAEAQKFMAAAGLLSGSWRWGVWDEKTRNAWKDVLAYANGRGITDQMALMELARSVPSGAPGGGGGQGGGGGGGYWTVDDSGNPVFVEEGFQAPPLQLKVSNKDDLRRVFRTAVIDLLGEGWSQQQINEVVDAYNWQEIKVQKDAYDQEVQRMEDEFYGRPTSSEPITQVDMVSPETFIEEQARKRDPGGFEATQVAEDYAPAFFAALGGYT